MGTEKQNMNAMKPNKRKFDEEPVPAIHETRDGRSVVQSIWRESLHAELDGDLQQALEIHEQILSVIGHSYAVDLRAGWLHYQSGAYGKALDFYLKAAGREPELVEPLLGVLGCYVARGDAARATAVLEEIARIEGLHRASRSA